MRDLLTPADIERLAHARGILMADVLREAGVSPSIFTRWKAGKTEPNLVNYRRIRDAAMGNARKTKRSAPPESMPPDSPEGESVRRRRKAA